MTLEIYPVVLELVRRLSPVLPKLRARSVSLGDQMERALISVPLNVAEGAYSRGKNRQARYQTAAASAREALACWETAQALGLVQSDGAGARGAVPPRDRHARAADEISLLRRIAAAPER